MHFRKVTVIRDETAHVNVLVGDWEVSMLEAVHGSERIKVGELQDFPNRPWPEDAASEFQRLGNLYGTTGNGDNAQSFVERVYGSGRMGVAALDKAMKEARKNAPKSKPKSKPDAEAEALAG